MFSHVFRTPHRGLSQPIRYHNNEGRKITYFSLKLLQPFCFMRYAAVSGRELRILSGKSGTVGNSENSRKRSERLSSISRFQTLQKLIAYLKMENTEALDNLSSLINV